MKPYRKILSFLLLFCILLPILPMSALPDGTEGGQDENKGATDAMETIRQNEMLAAFRQGSTHREANDGYIGIPYETTVYYDSAKGAATPGYMTLGATPVILYVVNTNTERIGTDSDIDILRSLLERGYVVVVLDYLNHPKAQSPALEWSVQLLRNRMASGAFFTDKTLFPAGTYTDSLALPAGYNVTLNEVYFSLDKHGTDGTLEKIVNVWNNDFRMYKKDSVVRWVHEDGSRKTVQNAFDGTAPVWYRDAAGKTVDNAKGTYTKIAYTKAETITDCVRPDGTPIDLDLYFHTMYPTHPAKEVPVMALFASTDYLMNSFSKQDRPQFFGFLFNGYAGVMFDYGMIPMGRSDHYGSFNGSSGAGKSVTGDNMTYATYTYNASQIATAGMRYTRYLALSKPETYRFDIDHIGIYGISKASWMTHLGAPILRENLLTAADGKTDAEVAQSVNEKINSFYNMRLLPGQSGKTRYDKGITSSYTKDGVTIRGGELQPWAAWGGAEISSGAQAVYSCCGGAPDYLGKGYAPLFITKNLMDNYNTEYGQQNILVNLCHNLNLPALWYEAEIAHTFAQGKDAVYGVDIYDALFRFMDYYLKETPVSVTYSNPASGSVIRTTSGITLKFIGEVPESEIRHAVLTDADGNAVSGSWKSAYGNTEWTFTPESAMKGGAQYTLTLPAEMKGANGVPMGKSYTASFFTRPENTAPLSSGTELLLNTTGTALRLTVPEYSGATGYRFRLYVTDNAANLVSACDAETGAEIGSVRVSGEGYYEIDATDYLAGFAPGSERSVLFRTQTAAGNSVRYAENFESGTGAFRASYAQIDAASAPDGARVLRVVAKTNAGKYKGDHVIYENMENAFVFANDVLIENGAAMTRADLGRTFLIRVRVYDTVSRPIRFWLNSATSRSDRILDYDRVYYAFETKAGEWSEFSFPYTVYEAKYGVLSQKKTLYVQLHPTGSTEMPAYFDDFTVTECYSDVAVSGISLVMEQNGGSPVKMPAGEKAFSVDGKTYDSWKEAMTAATSGKTVTMLRNYTFTDSDLINLAGKEDITIDLGGYRLTAANTGKAPLWVGASDPSLTSVILRDGSVILTGSPLFHSDLTAAGDGKSIDVQLRNVYLTVGEASAVTNPLFGGTASGNAQATVYFTFTDSIIDLAREHLPERELTLFDTGTGGIKVRYAFFGGALRIDSFRDIRVGGSVLRAGANEKGEFLTGYFPDSAGIPVLFFKKGDSFAELTPGTTENGWRVCILKQAKYSTAYGAIPEKFAGNATYPFLLFYEGAFLDATGSWKDVCTKARETLRANPGSTMEILLQADYTVESYSGNSNWLCFMDGNMMLDLGGHTIRTEKSLFEAGVDKSYTGSKYSAGLTVRNGTLLIGSGNLFAGQNNSNYDKTINVAFENVTFGIDPETYTQNRNRLFFGQKDNANYRGCLKLSLELNDCTIDLRGIPGSFTVFSFASTEVAIAADIRMKGGKILADSMDSITFLTMDESNDSFLFCKGANGTYSTITLPATAQRPGISGKNEEGAPVRFGSPVTFGSETVWSLTESRDVVTDYGTIPAEYVDSTFVLFRNGSFLCALSSWKDICTKARETLKANPGSTMEILLQADYTVESYSGNSNWLCFMDGNMMLDLGGHTIRTEKSLFEAGVDKSYTGSKYSAGLTVRNGTLLIGSGNLFAGQNNSNYDKTINVAFENVTFGIDPETYTQNRNRLFFGQKDNANYRGCLKLSLELNDCTIDLRGIPGSFTVFSFASTEVAIAADIRMKGGRILADSMDSITFLTMDESNDSFLFCKGTNGAYPAMIVADGRALQTEFQTPEGTASFTETEEEHTWYLTIGGVRITGASVHLGADLAVRYYVKIPDAWLEKIGTVSMRFTINGRSVTVTDYRVIDGEYVFTFTGIAPQEMSDRIDAVVLADGKECAARSGYSIRDNCRNLLEKSAAELGLSEGKYTAMRTLISDLLTYGAAAQEYRNWHTETPATAGVSGLQPSDAAPDQTWNMTMSTTDEEHLRFLSAAVYFSTANSICIRFRADVTEKESVVLRIGDKTFPLSGLVLTGENEYRVVLSNLPATAFGEKYTLELVQAGTVVATLTYSVNAYASAILGAAESSDGMKELALTLYRYGMSAAAYASAQ